MSAQGRGAEREPHDFYATPPWCVKRLLEAVPLPGGRWLEPSAGDGAIIRVAQAMRGDIEWHAVELRSSCKAELMRLVGSRCRIADYLEEPPPSRPFDVILTNPPYSLAEVFVEKALAEARFVVMLFRLNYLGSEKRAAFLKANPPDVHVLPNRPRFVRNQSDSCEYGWFLWGPDRKRRAGNVSVLGTTPRVERLGNRSRKRSIASSPSLPFVDG